MMYFTSDLHIHHSNILKYTERPYSNLNEMHVGILQKWNSVVGNDDTCYHLGDFTFAGKSKAPIIKDILAQLNGKIILLAGNHDDMELWDNLIKIAPELCANYPHDTARIQFVRSPYMEVTHQNGKQKQKIILCHFPIASWNFQQYGAVHLFGHLHGSNPNIVGGKSMDVGVDAIKDGVPISAAEVVDIMQHKQVLMRHGAVR